MSLPLNKKLRYIFFSNIYVTLIIIITLLSFLCPTHMHYLRQKMTHHSKKYHNNDWKCKHLYKMFGKKKRTKIQHIFIELRAYAHRSTKATWNVKRMTNERTLGKNGTGNGHVRYLLNQNLFYRIQNGLAINAVANVPKRCIAVHLTLSMNSTLESVCVREREEGATSYDYLYLLLLRAIWNVK